MHLLKHEQWAGVMAHSSNPSCTRGRGRKVTSSRPTWEPKETLSHKTEKGREELGDNHLPGTREAWGLIPSATATTKSEQQDYKGLQNEQDLRELCGAQKHLN